MLIFLINMLTTAQLTLISTAKIQILGGKDRLINIKYNPQNEMFAAFETNRSLLKNETYPKFKKFSPGFAGV